MIKDFEEGTTETDIIHAMRKDHQVEVWEVRIFTGIRRTMAAITAKQNVKTEIWMRTETRMKMGKNMIWIERKGSDNPTGQRRCCTQSRARHADARVCCHRRKRVPGFVTRGTPSQEAETAGRPLLCAP